MIFNYNLLVVMFVMLAVVMVTTLSMAVSYFVSFWRAHVRAKADKREYEIDELSEFYRAYVCRDDEGDLFLFFTKPAYVNGLWVLAESESESMKCNSQVRGIVRLQGESFPDVNVGDIMDVMVRVTLDDDFIF